MFCILFAHSSFRVVRTRRGSSTFTLTLIKVIAPAPERLLLLLFSGSPLFLILGLAALRFLFGVICLSQNKSPSVTAIVDPVSTLSSRWDGRVQSDFQMPLTSTFSDSPLNLEKPYDAFNFRKEVFLDYGLENPDHGLTNLKQFHQILRDDLSFLDEAPSEYKYKYNVLSSNIGALLKDKRIAYETCQWYEELCYPGSEKGLLACQRSFGFWVGVFVENS